MLGSCYFQKYLLGAGTRPLLDGLAGSGRVAGLVLLVVVHIELIIKTTRMGGWPVNLKHEPEPSNIIGVLININMGKAVSSANKKHFNTK